MFRKDLSLALLFVFGFQSSASAAVAVPNAGPNFGSMIAAMQQSFIVMALMGEGDRYAKMHAPAPTFPRLQRDDMRPPDVRAHAAVRTARYGTFAASASTETRDFGWPLHVAPDPHAMSTCREKGRVDAKRGHCPQPTPSVSVKSANVLRAAAATPAPVSPTGINAFWTYSEKPLAGVGKAMVNVGNGNMVVQADDLDVPERGIDLAFRRSYNSMSQHDVSNSDGTNPSVYGNGWTNTFDAHVSYNATTNVVSVYDIDGARYDYTSDGNGNWIPPAGQHAVLQWDSDGGYLWTKKNGTFYVFMAPFDGYGWPKAEWGRLFKIRSRNWNNQVKVAYAFSGDGSDPETLTQIKLTHSDGQVMTLNFAKFGNYTELYQLVRPDNVVAATYNYDVNGNLLSVTRPGNAVDASTFAKTNGSLLEAYWYYAGTHLLNGVSNPNYEWSVNNTPGNVYGGYYGFAYDSANRIAAINDYAAVDFTPSDGFSVPLQSGSGPGMGVQFWRHEAFTGWGTGTVTASDTQGHSTMWTTDSLSRLTSMQEWTGSLWLATDYTWDADNNLTASIDPRGKETDYTYDSMGNTLSVEQPSTTTAWGTGRPMTRYVYDQFNNVIAECDANYEWQNGNGACPQGAGATRYTYDYSDQIIETYGRLTDVYTPLGYHQHITYDQNAETGDYGLPTSITGDCMTQADGTNRCPSKSLVYDGNGNVTSYNTGNGVWTVTYDGLNRTLTRKDPDGVSSYTCYNVDGSVAYSESASQHAKDGGVGCQATAPAYADAAYYDSDGNAIETISHKGQIVSDDPTGVTKKFYDGEDRLIEVQQPRDPRTWPNQPQNCGYDTLPYPWTTRYLYDNTGNVNGTFEGDQATTISGVSETIYGHGNLYATEEYLPSNTSNWTPATCPTGGSFIVERATNFDNLDRAVAQNELAFGTAPKQTTTYDANGYYGLATAITNANGQTTTPSYDSVARESQVAFANDATNTPARNISYCPNGEEASVSSSFGTATYQYDADGRMTTEVEPGPNAATLTYAYYADGSKKALSITSNAVTQSNLFQYSYRTDGEEEHRMVQYGGGTYNFAWTYTGAGREATESDPYSGQTYAVSGASPVTLGPKTYAYDSYGRVRSLVLPEKFTYANDQYDGDDEFAGFDGYDEWGNKRLSQSHVLNVRGALLQTYISWNGMTNTVQGPGTPTAFNGIAPAAGTYDLRSDMVLSNGDGSYSYDASGRKVTATSDSVKVVPITDRAGTTAYNDYTTTVDATTSFDAENHIVGISSVATCTGTNSNDPSIHLPCATNLYGTSHEAGPVSRTVFG